MPNPMVALVGSQIGSSILGSRASSRAASAQEAGAMAGVEEQRRQFDAIRELLKPYVEAGTPALSAQQAMLGLTTPEEEARQISMVEGSPTFNALLNTGEEALLQRASATGGLRGGNLQGALAQFRPQLLAQELQNRYEKLAGLTSLGQQSAVGVGNAGMQTGANVAQLLGSAGAARAGGYLAQGRGLQNLASIPSNVIGFGLGQGKSIKDSLGSFFGF